MVPDIAIRDVFSEGTNPLMVRVQSTSRIRNKQAWLPFYNGWVVRYCIERSELCDEVFCQLMRQVTKNPDADSRLRGWHVLAVCAVCLAPSDTLHPFLKASDSHITTSLPVFNMAPSIVICDVFCITAPSGPG